jgi:heptosyltransferase-2
MKILVRAPNWIGDQVLAFPFFFYLRKIFPKAEITASCVPWVKEIQFSGLVDRVHVLPRPAGSGLRDKWVATEQAAKEIRAFGKMDLAFALPNSFGAAWFLYRTRSQERVGYSTESRGLLLTQAIEWNEAEGGSSDADSDRMHRAQAYLNLLQTFARTERVALPDVRKFWPEPPENELDLGRPGVVESFDWAKYWKVSQGILPPAGSYWVLAPGATAESRRWPVSAFAELAARIRKETGLKGLIVGGPKEAPLAQELVEDSSLGLSDWTARGTVAEIAPLFANAEFTVTNESGLAHVASLCGSFVQIVCGAADPRRTRPIGPGRVQVAVNPIDCWPCERNTCLRTTGPKLECLGGILPEMVWGEIQRGLAIQRSHR